VRGHDGENVTEFLLQILRPDSLEDCRLTIDYENLKQLDHTYLWHPFTQMQEWMGEEPCIISHGAGNYLVDVHGRKYLDGVSSLWCNVHGHRKREIDDAIKAQLERIAHSTFLGLSHVPGIELAEKLIGIAPKRLQRVFYSDSGATAVEIALKMAVQYWQLKGATGKTQIATLAESYHGDTVGSMSIGYSEIFHRFHKSLLFPVLRITPPHVFRYYRTMSEIDALNASIKEAEEKLAQHYSSLAALIMEPLMQGAAGMWSQPAQYVRSMAELCRSHGILFVLDEVATGFGRTGKMFAAEHAGVTPDILCLAKGITAGYLPLAATLTTEEIFAAFLGEYRDFKTFFHGHTYTGNPLGCAAALASLEVFRREKIIEKMRPNIEYLCKRLEHDFLPLPHVSDVRQWGYMAGIELAENKAERRSYPSERRIGHKVILEARKHGVMIRPLGDVIILMPPLSITDEQVETLLDVVYRSIRAVTET
jgi:adenosylmethionine---8-amino-7-oxononanoate aminotransferase